MNCPHCQRELPEKYGTGWCPFCGHDLPSNQIDTLQSPPRPVIEPNHINWPKFFLILFAPAVGCFLALIVDIGGLAVLFGPFGGSISGLVCAHMIMEAVNFTGSKRTMIHFGLAILLCALSFFLCFVGCVSASTVSRHGI
jgi:hypothetical protein